MFTKTDKLSTTQKITHHHVVSLLINDVRHLQQQLLRLDSPVSILKNMLLGSYEIAKLSGNIFHFGASDCADLIPNKYRQISFDTQIN